MINLNIEGKTWPEVTQQLAELISEKQNAEADLDSAKEILDLKSELAETRANLNQAANIIRGLRADLEASRCRNAELEKMLDDAGEAPDENPTPEAEPVPVSDIEETVTTAPTAETATEPEQPKYDKAQVRKFLAEARNKGVNITDVLKPFGGRFPAVKEEDYPALMEATKAALAEKGAK